MSKKLIWVIVLVLVALGIFLLLRKEEVLAPNEELPAALPQEETTNTEVVNENLITYSDTGFAPSTLTVKVGDTVTWKNESEKSMWPASAMHPTHAVYPTTGGCLGSTFDACRGVLPGESWSFKFDIAGEWKYHNHLGPTFFGTVVVEEE